MAKNVNAPIAKSEDRVRTPKGRIVYPWLFKKDQMQDKYAMLLVCEDSNELTEFKNVVRTFGTKAFEGTFPDDMTWCVIPGDTWLKQKDKPPTGKLADAIAGKTVIKMKSDYAPAVSIIKAGVLEVIEEGESRAVYSGAIGAAQGVLAAFNGKYPAVVYWFSQVAKLGDGEKLTGTDPNKAFGGMYDPDDDSVGAAETGADLDDEIPF